MSASPEELKRLDQIFKGMDLKQALSHLDPRERSDEWIANPTGVKNAWSPEDYVLENGKASLQFRITGYWDFLKWTSDLPDFLNIFRYPGRVEEFIKFFSIEFPDMLFGYAAPIDQRPIKADVSLDGVRVSSDHDFSTEKGRAGFETRLLLEGERVSSLRIGTRIGESERPYWFDIVPVKGSSGKAKIGIGLLHSGERGWNEGVLGWALSTHEDRVFIGEFGTSAARLSDVIHRQLGSSDLVPKPNRIDTSE